MRTNYYQTLGVQENAEDIVIRAAYRALAQRYHPDKAHGKAKNGDATAQSLRMAAIQEAYEVLSDPARRAQYDAKQLRRPMAHTADFFPSEAELPARIGNIEAQAWEILRRFYPHLTKNLAQLEKGQAQLAATYRSMLMELISEKLVARLVNNICQEIQGVVDEEGKPSISNYSSTAQQHPRSHHLK